MGDARLHLSLLNTALDLTSSSVALHGWQVVLLGKRSKKPIGKHWTITRDVELIRRHVRHACTGGVPREVPAIR